MPRKIKIGVNGVNGHGASLSVRIEKRIAYHKHRVEVLEEALQDLTEEAIGTKVRASYGTGHPAMAAALAQEAARISESGAPTRKKEAPGYHATASVRDRRARTAEFLKQFDRTKPIQPPANPGKGGSGVGALVTAGYLKRKGTGYVRTAKPFNTKPPAGSAAVAKQRSATARLLAKMSTTDPIPASAIPGVSPLANHGYIVKQGDGYVRTAKPYEA